MALEVGSAFARLGAKLDPDGFDRWDRRWGETKREAAKPVVGKLHTEADLRESDRYERELKRLRSQKDAIKARLGADFDDDQFNRYDRELEAARRKAANKEAYQAHLSADMDRRGFDQYDRATKDVGRANRDVVSSNARLRTSFGTIWGRGGAAFAAAGGATALVLGVRAVIDAYGESQTVQFQTAAALKSTGGVANVTAKEIDHLATVTSMKAGVDDEAVGSAENLLLTFTRVRNAAGKNNDIFTQAVGITADLSRALGKDLSSTALMVGKALNDPIRGVTALGRAGVQLTDAQKEQIKAFVESGDVLSAQKIIMGELETQVGGSARAYGKTLPGAIDRAKVAVGNLMETVGGWLSGPASSFANWVTGFSNSLSKGGRGATGFQRDVIGAFGDVKEFIADTGRFVSQVIDDNQESLDSLGHTARSLGHTVTGALGGIKDVFGEVFGSGTGTGRDVRQILTVLIRFGAVVAQVFGATAKKAMGGFVEQIRALLLSVRGILRVLSGLLTLDFAKVLSGLKDIARAQLDRVKAVFRLATAPMRAAFGMIWEHIADPVRAAFQAVERIVGGALDKVLGGLTSVMKVAEGVLSALGHVPGMGWAKDAARDLHNLRDQLDKTRVQVRGWGKDSDDARERTKRLEDRVAKYAGQVSTARERLKNLRKGTDDYKDAAQDLRQKQDNLNGAMRDARAAANRGAQGVSGLGTAVENAAAAVGDAAGNIATNVNNLAKSLGSKGIEFTVAPSRRGRRTQSKVFGTLPGTGDAIPGSATGGYWGGGRIPGTGLQDSVPMLAGNQPVIVAPGEVAIVNRHQAAEVEDGLAIKKMMGLGAYGSLDELFAGIGRPHYMTRGGKVDWANARHAARGLQLPAGFKPTHMTAGPGWPAIDVFGSPGTVVLSPVSGEITRWSGQAGGPGGGGPYGWSMYLAGENDVNYYFTHMQDRFVRPNHHIRRGQPMGTIVDYPGGVPDHIHEAIVSGAIPSGPSGDTGAPARSAPRLPGVNVKGPKGGLKRIIDGAVSRMRRQGQGFLDRAAGQFKGPAGADQTGPAPRSLKGLAHAMRHAFSFRELMKLWTGAGGPGDAQHIMARVSIAESGGLPYARNPSGASGLWQILGAVLPGNLFDPLVNARNAIKKYRDGGLGPWTSSKGLWSSGLSDRQLVETYGHAGFARGGFGGRGVLRAAKGLPSKALAGATALGKVAAAARKTVAANKQTKGAAQAGQTAGQESISGSLRPMTRRANRSISAYDDVIASIQKLDRNIELKERRYARSEEVLIDEQTGLINQDQVNQRVAELEDLAGMRQRMVELYGQAREIARRVARTYRQIIRRLQNAIKAASPKNRPGLRDQLDQAQQDLPTWEENAADAGYNRRIAVEDVADLYAERDSVKGTKPEEVSTEDFTGQEPEEPQEEDTGETVFVPPSAEEIAQGVAAQLASFREQAASIFGSFGQNFVRAGVNPFGTEAGQLAGMRIFGGAQSSAGGILAAGGAPDLGAVPAGTTATGDARLVHFEQHNTFTQAPRDEGLFVRRGIAAAQAAALTV